MKRVYRIKSNKLFLNGLCIARANKVGLLKEAVLKLRKITDWGDFQWMDWAGDSPDMFPSGVGMQDSPWYNRLKSFWA